MTKLSITGLKRDLRPVIEELHNLELLDIEEYSGELETGETFEEGEEISQLLVDLRSLLSKLPKTENSDASGLGFEDIHGKIPELNEKVNRIEEDLSELEADINSIRSQRNFFKKVSNLDLDYIDFKGTRELECFVGKIDTEKFESNAPDSRYELMEGRGADVVFYPEGEGFETAIEKASTEVFEIPEVDLEGHVSEIEDKLVERLEDLRKDREEKQSELEQLSEEWREDLRETEDFMTEKVEKAEAPIKFATTDSAFFAKGWVPTEKFGKVEERLAQVTEGRVHVQEEEGESPPVKHDNIGPVKNFEDLTDLVSVPKYNELDPSFMLLLTFPLFFGFMIGDAGYGLTTLAVFYGGMKMFPGAADIFKSLMYASVATIIFGLAFGDAFGFVIFGSHSELTAATGIALFEQIPILWHRAEHLNQVFQISALIGLVHVNIGYLLGFYNEHVNHGFKEAFLEKGSWLMLEAGAALWYFVGMTAGAPVIAISVALLYLGEGVEGVVEIPSLLSNVLSYLRIFGVSVAAVSLAAVVNGLADPLFQSGSMIGIALGVVMLVFGHTFNTFIKIMEGFLQGIRLHYVEMFSKFYEGGGRKYVPFGAK
ncbi:MAG: V/A-type H+-transporting ATPase subunit I [Candidatus Nanohaloarchaea archaeon]|jgi:V/A-type H+-transporting ATPase subunit I